MRGGKRRDLAKAKAVAGAMAGLEGDAQSHSHSHSPLQPVILGGHRHFGWDVRAWRCQVVGGGWSI